MSNADVVSASRGRRRSRVVGSLLVAALAVCVLPGVAVAKKKTDKIGVMSYNLYLGSKLDNAVAAARATKFDGFSNEVGFVLNNVNANDFSVRAEQIAKDIRKKKADLVGLQEAALWKLQAPTDGGAPGAANPTAIRAITPLYDYLEILTRELNRKAKTNKECKKQDIPKSKCYRGYEVVVVANEADIEFAGDFDNNPGADGKTFDLADSGAEGLNAPNRWQEGNDDTGASFGNPPNPACHDGIDNDGDGTTDFPGLAPPGTDVDCLDSQDGSEGPDTPAALPADMNFDSHAFAPFQGGVSNGPFVPATGAGMDPPGTSECTDSKPTPGPAQGDGGSFPYPGYDAPVVNVCLFHGIDGDLSLTMRDAILKRKGAGVKTENDQGANFENVDALSIFGGSATVRFSRGYVATDANVRGKRFRFVNTHLESENDGSIREDQASELIAPNGPATAPTTVLVGDLNSDPNRNPVNLPDGDSDSNIAFNRLAAYGFSSLTGQLATFGHAELLSNQSRGLGESWIDHILTNDPESIEAKGDPQVVDTFANGLWNSDHGGVFVRIKGKKR